KSDSVSLMMEPGQQVYEGQQHSNNYSLPLEDAPPEDSGKSNGKLGKKWRNVITRTMTRKTSKMVQKALAEGWGKKVFSQPPIVQVLPLKKMREACNFHHRYTSTMRDKMRKKNPENHICTDILQNTQKGDIIQIIEKPPVGTWTGKLNNKVGSFKFIYVTILPEEDTPPKRKRCRSQGRKNKSKPQTLEEVLERIGLTELGSLLSMHGFQSLEDFRGLKESHMNELNITDPEQRVKILKATELFHDCKSTKEPSSLEQKTEMPRDSGCYESTENLANGREEPQVESQPEPETDPDTETKLNAIQEQLEEMKVEESPESPTE
uniref:SAM and SH3 domain containing 3 n=1 Tax=Sinocyclocheilus grahami TaxID=75366 RepID=A0A672T6F9_SINGR